MKTNYMVTAWVFGVLAAGNAYALVHNAVRVANNELFIRQARTFYSSPELSDVLKSSIEKAEKEASTAKWDGLEMALLAGLLGPVVIYHAVKAAQKEEKP